MSDLPLPRFPVFIVSKGRAKTALTAKSFQKHGVPFKILVEPQEERAYRKALGSECIEVLPFSNLGLGSYPARNHAWELAKKQGAEYHWVFDDNIRRFRVWVDGVRVPLHDLRGFQMAEDFMSRYENLAICGFVYAFQCIPGSNYTARPYTLNAHCYSAMGIKTSLPFRWRLKYNEDVDLCLQALHAGYCTALVSAVMVEKTSTVLKMAGGNQTELYQNNAHHKKVEKAQTLASVWPQYAKTAVRYNRPHHFVDWSKFNQPLIRKPNISATKIALTLKRR